MSEIELLKDWKLVKLGEIGEYKYGYNGKASSDKSGKQYLRITDINEDGSLKPNRVYVQISKNDFEKYCLKNNDIVIARTGATVGKSFLFTGNDDFVFASYLIRFRFDVQKTIPKFLLYVLKSPTYWNFIGNSQSVSAQPNVNATKMSKFEFRIPPLNTQKKIVQKLDHILGQLEEKKKEIISRIEKFDAKKINQNHKNHLLKLAFDGTLTNEKPGEIIDGIQVPKGWELKKISDIIEILYGKGLPKDKRNNGGKFPVYGSNGVVGTHTEYLIDYPSIIIGRKGSAGAINLTSTKFWPTDVTYYVKIKNSKIPLKFVYYLLNDLNLHKLIQSGPKPGLNRNDVYELDFLFPVSNETQKKIVEILDKKFVEWETHKQELENIQNRHDSIKKHLSNLSLSILNDAFSGKLVN